MQQSLLLFDDPEPDIRGLLRNRLHELASTQHLLIGTSSWKYEGWLGSIYTKERYTVRGRFARHRFGQDCLREYAEVFPTVCGDFAFYQFPSASFWRKLFAQVPESFLFAFKVPEDITLPVYPNHPRYGARAGRSNPNFLSIELLQNELLHLLKPYASQVSVLIFEFAAISGKVFPNANAFSSALAPFLSALPAQFRYAIEVRDAQLLEAAYFQALRDHGISHVFNSWTGMPELSEQILNPEAFTTDFVITRALLKPGRKYEEAVEQFSPYTEIREALPSVRKALRELLIRAKNRSEPIYVFVNNRLEGFAPGTIAALVEDF